MFHFVYSVKSLMSVYLVASSVDIERIWSCGRTLLPHNRNRLSMASIRALLCLGEWSRKGLVNRDDLIEIASMNDLKGDAEVDGDGNEL